MQGVHRLGKRMREHRSPTPPIRSSGHDTSPTPRPRRPEGAALPPPRRPPVSDTQVRPTDHNDTSRTPRTPRTTRVAGKTTKRSSPQKRHGARQSQAGGSRPIRSDGSSSTGAFSNKESKRAAQDAYRITRSDTPPDIKNLMV
jgi:hypothetical protein